MLLYDGSMLHRAHRCCCLDGDTAFVHCMLCCCQDIFQTFDCFPDTPRLSAVQRRRAAEAALESVVLLARWACEPLQGGEVVPSVAEEQDMAAVNLLCKAAAGGGSGGGSSWVAAAVAAASWQQGQRCALTLADILAAAAAQKGAALTAPKLAFVARLLRCICGDFGPCGRNVSTAGSTTSSSGGSGVGPLTLGCVRSRQGQQLLHTRVAVPAKLLAIVANWFGDGTGPPARLLQVRCYQTGAVSWCATESSADWKDPGAACLCIGQLQAACLKSYVWAPSAWHQHVRP